VEAFLLAREDLRKGRSWMARDRLLGTLGMRRGDAEGLLLLGEVHVAMNDLPAAGAAWFLTARPDSDSSRAADAAFRARYPKPAARAERLPMHRPLSEYPDEAIERVKALRSELETDGWRWHPPAKAQPPGRHALRRHRDSFPEVSDDDDYDNWLPSTWRSRLRHATSDVSLRDIVFGAFLIYMFVAFFAVWVIGFITAMRWIWG